MAVVKAGNFELHYVEEGRGFPLVLIHGLAGDWTAWKPYLAALKDRYRVIAFDNPGSGQSSAVTRPVRMAELGQATLALMDRLGVERAHVVGRSMGGAIAQEMAFAAPGRIQSLAMAGSFARLDPLGERLIRNMRDLLQWRKNWAEWAKVFSPSFVSPDFFNANPERIADIERLLSDPNRDQVSYAHLAQCVLDHDALERIGTLRCPVLILAGQLDPICSRTSTGWMKERLPQAEMVVFEKSSHFFLMEEAPKAIATLKDWLERHTPR